MTSNQLTSSPASSSQEKFFLLKQHLQQSIVGQNRLLERLMVSVLCGGHILLEGLPGLAKTTAVTSLASGIHATYKRIQFTPDLMPGDLTGSEIYDPKSAEFRFIKGPLFNEIILADEINRAPPKVQSALLEAMQEHQVTVGGITRSLPALFVVMATQNPLEQAGTYPLPEAQLDRFLLHVVLSYPSEDDELKILQLDRKRHFGEDSVSPSVAHLQPETVLTARREAAEIFVDPKLEKYIVSLVTTTRDISKLDKKWDDHLIAGASPRASIALLRSATAIAYLRGREYLIPEDIHEIAADVLRHRLVLKYSAQSAGLNGDKIIQKLLEQVPLP